MHSINKTSAIVAGVAGSAIGAIIYNLLPMFLGMAQEFRGLDNFDIGILGFVFFLGFNLATFSAFFWIRKVDWQRASLLFLPVASLALYGAAWTNSFWVLNGAIFITGGCLASVYGIAATLLGDTSEPARWYGVKIGAETVLGAVLLILLPIYVVDGYGFKGFLISVSIVVMLFVPFMFGMPSAIETEEEPSAPNADSYPNTAIYMMLVATFLWFCGQTVLWSFIERIGNGSGFSNDQTGLALALSLCFATAGSLLAAWLNNKIGTLKPFFIASSLLLLVLPVFLTELSFITYVIGISLMMLGVGMGIPYCYAHVAKLDGDGRFTVLVVPAVGMGAMLAPLLAGWLSDSGSFTGLIVSSAVLTAVAMALAFLSGRFSVDIDSI